MATRRNAAGLALAGVGVVLGGVGAVSWCVANGHLFLAFLAVAVMLGALVPLYPPEEKPDNFV